MLKILPKISTLCWHRLYHALKCLVC